MKILVIGNGFLGAAIIRRLEDDGHEILVFSRSRSQETHGEQVIGNIFSIEDFIQVFAWNPEVIIQTAWITTPGKYKEDLINIEYSNFNTNLARLVTRSNCKKLIILGSCAEYGEQVYPSCAGVTRLAPISLYAEQKVATLNSVQNILSKSDIRLNWARIFYPYGPKQDGRRLIPKLIHSLKTEIPLDLDDTSSIYDWITTRDIASAISWIIDHDLPIEVDVGSKIGHTNLEILHQIEKLLGLQGESMQNANHSVGPGEYFVASAESPIFKSGWKAEDTLTTGLEWILS